MKMEMASEFDKVRDAARTIEDVMGTVNNALSNPLRIFDNSKCVESEIIVKGEIQTCKDLIADVADVKREMNHNLHATDDFLKQAKAFTDGVSSGLKDFEAYLSQFGYKKPEDSIAEDESVGTITESIPPFENGAPASDIDTSGVIEFDDSLVNSRLSNGTAKLNRELSFDH